MDEIQVQATFTIHEGRLADFRAAAERAVSAVRTHDTGTKQYDWFFSADEKTCIVRETYESSRAVLDHIEHVRPILGDLVDAASLTIQVFGRPSDELEKAGEPFGQVIYEPYLSL